jgi:hypothetical protein
MTPIEAAAAANDPTDMPMQPAIKNNPNAADRPFVTYALNATRTNIAVRRAALLPVMSPNLLDRQSVVNGANIARRAAMALLPTESQLIC